MPAALEITERLLSDAGGWQALKEARGLWEAGKAQGTYDPPFLRGAVRDGIKEYKAGLRIVTRTNIENLCTCRISRDRGMVCAHSLAVGLAVLRGEPPKGEKKDGQDCGINRSEEKAVDQDEFLAPGRPVFLLRLEGSLNHLTATLQVRYADHLLRAGEGSALRYRAEAGGWRGRNPEAERAALDRLRAAGFSQPGAEGLMALKGERAILRFLGGALPQLEREWKVELGARFSNINEGIARIRPRVDVQGSGEDWFEFSVSLGTPEGQAFSSAEIHRLLEMGQNHVRMKNGGIALFDPGMLDELAQALADCDPRQARPGAYRIGRAHAGYIAGLLGEESSGPPEWRRWTRQQLEPDRIAPVPLGELDDVLRPYQKHGVYWMHFLARNGFGGILADEMGLGKTLQALTFIQGLSGGVSLIVCPSSLVQNWAREAAKFTPGLKVVALEGADRHARMAGLADARLAITSYPLLRRDAERYAGVEFQAIVLDEAQHIKNPDTQNAQAAMGLRARHRLVLTGTPLENSVRDLWSIMNFVMPGYLGSRSDFKERYEQPIVHGVEGGPVKNRLAKRVRPFLLRRTKRDVYKELPEKIEQVVYCSMTTQQREVYQNLLLESRRQITELSSAQDANKGRMLMLTALLRLRQACCDLRLLGIPELTQEQASAKLELLDELLREAIDGGHRVLIFSQFVTMLQLLKSALEAADIAYCYLDGQTKDRMKPVDLFQNDPAVPVFLISLKAGGVGLNLTGADTVVHFDPWWNPAVEAQATDRAHRIGQDKVVTAYKLITRGTVEEKILKLQATKRGLMEAIESEEPVMGGLSTAEIQELLG